jgi:hypothetical protein
MPEDVKAPSSFGRLFSLRWWFPSSLDQWLFRGAIFVFVLAILWFTTIEWSYRQADARVQKLAKGVEIEVQAANPVGSTKRDVNDWLTAQVFMALNQAL